MSWQPSKIPPKAMSRDFLWFYFINEQFNRYLGTRIPPWTFDTVPLLVFWSLAFFWLAPWMIFLPQSLKQVPHHWHQLRGDLARTQEAGLFFMIWALVVIGFFMFSTRQEYYTIPAVPALALFNRRMASRGGTAS
jgi:hypothetical protein